MGTASGSDPVQPPASRQAAYAELCRRAALDDYGPATVLINAKLECLHFQGPTDRYLKIPRGRPGQDLIANAREDVRAKLRLAVEAALHDAGAASSEQAGPDPQTIPSSFRIVVKPAACENERLFLVIFVDEPASGIVGPETPGADSESMEELKRELQATKSELQSAISNLEAATEQQSTISDEARSVSEEYQATNEELLASKEELQSLNEELTALNGQLQETLERERTTAADLQNVLYSTKIATMFLDTSFNIRFFTPATRSLFNVIPGDLGRPLEDLKALASDGNLLSDARTVLEKEGPIEREVEGQRGAWFVRRVLPYRTVAEKTEGVVITFEDVTERRRAADALAAARREAELASLAKSRFLAAASHDLRQPLQTLALLQGLLAKNVVGQEGQQLIERTGEALNATTGTLNALLGISQIEAGAVKAEMADFPVNDLFDRLREELAYHAKAANLVLRVIPCGLFDSNGSAASRGDGPQSSLECSEIYRPGKILVGCRRRNGKAHIELGILGSEFQRRSCRRFRRIPSIGQPGPPAGPRSRVGTFHRQDLGRVASPSDRRALGRGKGLDVLDRGSAGARRERPVAFASASRRRRQTDRAGPTNGVNSYHRG